MASQNRSPLVSKTLEINYRQIKRNKSLKWGAINLVFLIILTYDLKYKCPYYTSAFHYVEYLLTIIFGLNMLYHCGRYVYLTFTLTPVTVTPTQKKLLGFKDNDLSFQYKSTPVQNVREENSLINLSVKSWNSNSSLNESANRSMPSPSWVYTKGSPSMPQYHPYHLDFNKRDESLDESFQDYLKGVEEKEKLATINGSFENGPRDASVFWNHPSTRVAKDISPTYKRFQYQLAPLNGEMPHVNEEGSPKSLQSSPQLWNKLRMDPQNLTQWNANLRKWISSTILDSIAKEIKGIDEGLLKCGLTDIRIGHVGLDRLKKSAQTVQIMQQIPTLSILVPFMEISNNQEYLVQRIKELSTGGCMSDFKWNSGGNLHGKPWDESLPNDATLIMHYFATYLDTQLMPIIQNPEGLPFTSQHFCKTPDKPNKNPNSLIIHQTSIHPPHFLLIVGEETCEISKGRNNLIHTLLLFLHTVATRHHGMLGRVNLGKSGINILWVVDQ